MAVASASHRLPLQGLTAKAARSTLDEKSAGSPKARLFQRDVFEDPQRAARPAASTVRPQAAVQSESWIALAATWDSLKKLLEVIEEMARLRKKLHELIMGLWK